ncbi:MAG TPA: hypothetical protein VKZ53_00680 [Candidatus Angelobacter sp.]|nr:hypothetical protein [Candidatus Angelobacter sp.]
MRRFFSFLSLLIVGGFSLQPLAQEVHLHEPGTGAICQRSTFAHGYRHGYEEGYHLGNIDANMGRSARTRLSQFRDAAQGYSPEFGPHKSFRDGFQAGLLAGYGDGYKGRGFRAIETFRFASAILAEESEPGDPQNVNFDLGFAAGYEKGLHLTRAEISPQGPNPQANEASVSCEEAHSSTSDAGASLALALPKPSQEITQQAMEPFCEGYRRGFALGHADGIALHPDQGQVAGR